MMVCHLMKMQEKALELARENRISAIVATPHVTPGVISKDDIHDFIQMN